MTIAATRPRTRLPYARELAASAVGYLVATAVLRWTPLPFTIPTKFDSAAALIAFASMILFGGLALLLLRSRPHGERLAAAGALTLPVLLGDALETADFAQVFPHFDPAAAGVFAAILLFTNFALLGAGLIAERLR